ncbi:MAG: YceI family protein, partial [Gemmatimonadetes bacterium]|nr:YceI family protein [Gemmatimonadota bacterium]
ITDGDLRTTAVDVTIGTASVDTRMPQRDDHLKSPDFFDVATFPTATFRGTGATKNGHGTWALPGTLTLRGVSQPVTLTVTPLGSGTDPWGNTRAAWSATAKLDRRAFGLNWNQALEAGGLLVANEIDLSIDLQAVLPRA